jgi:hypothetical protein
MNFPKSHFTEHLVRLNSLSFSRWVFEPGMLFLSEMKWWGDKGRRRHRHNGLDLQGYAADDGTVSILNAGTKVPMLFDGTIVRVMTDFLGYTFFAVHEIHDSGSQLFTIYGHLQPAGDFREGKYLHEGAVFATITGKGGTVVPPHIHLSVAFIPETVRTESLTWKTLDEDDKIRFIDPRQLI